MPKYKPGYSADGRHWVSESSGTDRDGMQWTIPGHWSDPPSPAPIHEPEIPTCKSTHRCKMNGAFIVLGGYVQIYDNEVPAGQRGHELYLKFGGLGVGGMDADGILGIKVSSWDEFYNKVSSFAYLAAVPSMEVPSSKLAHTVIAFYDSGRNIVGYAMPDVSADIGIAGGAVTVKG